MRTRFEGGCSPLEGGKALGLSASLWGEQVITYAGFRPSPKSTPHPGRVTPAPAAGKPTSASRTQDEGREARPRAARMAPVTATGGSGIRSAKNPRRSLTRVALVASRRQLDGDAEREGEDSERGAGRGRHAVGEVLHRPLAGERAERGHPPQPCAQEQDRE